MNREWIIVAVLLAIVTVELRLLWKNPARTQAAAREQLDAAAASSPLASSLGHGSGLTKSEEDRVLLGDIAKVPFQELFGLLARRTPEEIAQLAAQLQSLPHNSASDAKVMVFYNVWATLDPPAAFASALAIAEARFRGRALRAVVNNADASAAGELATSINRLPPDRLSANEKVNLISNAVSRWAQADPVAAAQLLDEIGAKGMEFYGASNATTYNWAARDPAAALAWAQKHEDSNGHQALQGALNGWWQIDPRAAEAYVAAQPLTDRGEMFASFANRLFTQDSERAREWVGSLPNAARSSAVGTLAQQWAMEDPAAAAQWVAGLPARDREGSLGLVARVWARQDPKAAGEFLHSLGGTARDEAVASYSGALSYEQPSLALTWAATISETKSRPALEEQLATEWLRRDPNGARIGIQNSPLPPAEKAHLLEIAPPP